MGARAAAHRQRVRVHGCNVALKFCKREIKKKDSELANIIYTGILGRIGNVEHGIENHASTVGRAFDGLTERGSDKFGVWCLELSAQRLDQLYEIDFVSRCKAHIAAIAIALPPEEASDFVVRGAGEEIGEIGEDVLGAVGIAVILLARHPVNRLRSRAFLPSLR